MKRPTKPTTIKLAAVTGLIALSGTGYALQLNQTTGANEVPPIYTQVEDHEVRIDSLEGRADTTEATVEQNSADIQVIQQETGTSPAPTTTTTSGTTEQPVTQTTTSEPAPAPTPAPEPAPHPRTITAVSEAPSTHGLHSCTYTLYDPIQSSRQGIVLQPESIPCHQVGEVLPQL